MTYKLFILHSWDHDDDYKALNDLLNNTRLGFYDFSASRDKPIEGTATDAELREAIKQKMLPVSCVIALAGVYASHSKWMEIEIEVAHELNKKIVGVRPRGNKRISQLVQDNAFEIVNWNAESLRKAIKRAVD